MKVLTYAGFLLESIKDTKCSLQNEKSKMAKLVNQHNMQRHSLNSIEADLKHDKGLVRELEKEMRQSE